MPRNGSGTYSLPAGNPVVSGTTIQASWANSTLADISTELTGSLARSGAGGMLGSLRGVDGTVSVPAFSFTSETTSGFYRAGTGDVRFAMAGADVYTVTSTGVGIGTTSPGEKLAVGQGNIYVLRTGGAKLRLADQNNEVSVESSPTGVVSNMIFKTAAATQMTLDSSGNLGIGTSSPAAKLQVVGGQVLLDNGQFYGIKTSGGANNSVLNLDASNNLLIGAGGATVTTQLWTGGTERARITSDGKLALGWPEARADLDVGTNTATAITKSIHLGFSDEDYYGFRIANANTASLTYAGTLAFQRGTGAAWADVVTITDGGNLLVNTSTIAGDGGYTFLVQAGGIAAINNNNSASTGYVFSSYRRGGTEIGSVTQNGTTAVLFNTTSDERLKENISPAAEAGDLLDAINIVQFDWKSDGSHQPYGVLAQNLQSVAAYAVKEGDSGETVTDPWAVDYSKLVPMLIKEIQQLRARVTALEAA